jgi:adenosylmethionine-8-amino-7-oxononanoate aminotransferase
MTDLIVLGTDTDAGKTTFSLLWLAAFAHCFDYWKPVESGPSDSRRVAELVDSGHWPVVGEEGRPTAIIHEPVKRLAGAVAPPLAARLENDQVPSAAQLAATRPATAQGRALLIETFGSPFSPLNEHELQIALIHALAAPCLLVSSSALGAIGRSLQCLEALQGRDLRPRAVVLIGPPDDYAAEQIHQHGQVPVFQLRPPTTWVVAGVQAAAREQVVVLEAIHEAVFGFRFSVFGHEQSAGLPLRVPKTENRKPKTLSLVDRDRRAVWHPYTSLGEPDASLECVGAQDEFLHLADGRRIMDGISSWWTILHGHRHPVLLAALEKATAAFDHVHFAGVTHAPAVELAELLLSTMPWKDGRVFYSDNGSTAVEVALKMAYQYWCHRGQPERSRFIGFQAGYHGDTFGAMAVSRDPVFFGTFEPLLFQADVIPLSPRALDDALAARKGKVAAVILEPLVQGAGGMRMHSPELLGDLFEVTRKHDVLLIADEVMTGGGRTGWLWAFQSAGIAPDLVCAAKTLAGGILPLAATLVAPHLVEAWRTTDPRRTFFHGHSFTAHPLACAVAVANWKLLLSGHPLTTHPSPLTNRTESFWNTALEPLRASPQVRTVRVRGAIAAVELDTPGGYLADIGRRLRRTCLDHGVLLRPLGSVLYAMPPFCTSQQSLEQIAQAMYAAVSQA